MAETRFTGMNMGFDGWMPIVGTFTYNSATAINVASGAALIYSVGGKLRLQNNNSGTYLYFYIVGIADTLLTVVGDTVPNATLTDNDYSNVQSPVGFPHYFTWASVFSGGAMTVTGYSIRFQKFSMNGRTVNYHLAAYPCNLGGTAATSIIFTLPVVGNASMNSWSSSIGSCLFLVKTRNSGSGLGVWGQGLYQSTSLGYVYLANQGNWSLGTNRYFVATGSYDAA